MRAAAHLGLAPALAAALCLAAFALPLGAQSPSPKGKHFSPNVMAAPLAPAAQDLVSLPGLPPFGKWMYGPDFQPAHWLGLSFEGRKIREPINVVIRDVFSMGPDEAIANLLENCRLAGFPASTGHSTGYLGYIEGAFYGQLPVGGGQAFADGPPELANDHGRIFGPYFRDGCYWFIGAFSREAVNPTSKVLHHYQSFDRARDYFAERMAWRAGLEISRYLCLTNDVLPVDGQGFTTGDHDGVAVFLTFSDPKRRLPIDAAAVPIPTVLPAQTQLPMASPTPGR